MVTSAIATPALPAVNESKANTRCRFSCNDNKSMETTPSNPEIDIGEETVSNYPKRNISIHVVL